MDEHEKRWADEVAAYALGALEPAEAAELEAHLEECERCRMALRWLTPAVAALPEDVERQSPPRRVREKVMTEVRADAKRARAEEGAGEGFSLRESWFGRFRSAAYGWKPAAAVAVLALVLVAFAGYEIGSNGGGEEPPVAREFTSEEESGIKVRMVSEGEGGTLALENVDQLPEGRVLEAWVQREGEVEAVPALFVPDDEGNAATTIESMDGVEVVMVTTEPKGGSETPTSDPIVTMAVPE